MSSDRTLRHIYHELVGHPFFPLMFIGEAIKAYISGANTAEEFAILAVGATTLWVLSDAVDIDVDLSRIVG